MSTRLGVWRESNPHPGDHNPVCLPFHHRHQDVTNIYGRYAMAPAGIEPGISRLSGACIVHYATRPSCSAPRVGIEPTADTG